MEQQFADALFTSALFQDDSAGCIGMRLFVREQGETTRKAEITYWDATGHFYVETFGDVPLQILERLLSEAKDAIKA